MGRRPLVRALLLVITATLMAAGPAHAGTVSLEATCPANCGGPPGKTLVFHGSPGENNDIVVTTGNGNVYVTENNPDATLTAGSSDCTVSGKVATCHQTDFTWFYVLYGGDGDDHLSTTNASTGQEYLFGGPGNDVLDGANHECCVGGYFEGGPGDDIFHGGTGGYDDVGYRDRSAPIDASLAPRPAGARNGEVGEHDVIGDDIDGLWGGQGDDVLYGDDGANYIWTENGYDVIHAGAGADVLWAYSFDDPGDELYGEDGDDHIYPGPRPITVDGGAGRDSARFDNYGPTWYHRLSLDGQANDGGIVPEDFRFNPQPPTGLLTAIEDIRGGEAGDLMLGDAAPNDIEAGGGDDVIWAGPGTDTVDADWGTYDTGGDDFIYTLDGEVDAVRCGEGLDIVVADPSDQLYDDCEQVSFEDLPLPELAIPWPPVPEPPGGIELPPTTTLPPPGGVIPLPVVVPPPAGSSPAARAALSGRFCTQTPQHAVRRQGGPTDDCFRGSVLDDLLLGAGGADRLLGGRGADRLAGGSGGDTLDGGSGDDRLDGGTGGDFVIGGRGRDVLRGRAGDDVVVASDGQADRVDCGGGKDRAVVDAADTVRGCESVERTRSRR